MTMTRRVRVNSGTTGSLARRSMGFSGGLANRRNAIEPARRVPHLHKRKRAVQRDEREPGERRTH